MGSAARGSGRTQQAAANAGEWLGKRELGVEGEVAEVEAENAEMRKRIVNSESKLEGLEKLIREKLEELSQ